MAVQLLAVSLGLLLTLSGCMGTGFSPQAVAFQEAKNYNMPDFRIDPATIQVLQQAPAGNSQIVMVRFQGVRQGSGNEACVFTFEVHKSRFGAWEAGGGGGGCSGQAPDAAKEPVTIGGGSGSSDAPGDLGYSSVAGEVFNDAIHSVRVTWNDDTQQEVQVINHSYLAARTGQAQMKKLEALDADQKVLYTNEPMVDPSKIDAGGNPQ